jgi:hypothetical protein
MTQEELAAVLADHDLWLDEKGGKRANLYGATLDFADLTGANLCGANLNATNLHRAKMRNADLNGASLNGANLYGADLTRANLYGVGFYGAILTRAKLDGADLTDASFEGAEIKGGIKVVQLLRRAMRSDGQELFLWQCKDGFYIKSGQMILPIDEAAPFWEESRGGTPLGDECLDILDMFQKAIKRATITPQFPIPVGER